MAMYDENCHPQERDLNLSMSSVKAGAAVFGNLVFGSECPEHSLCYSPSPQVNRRSDEDAPQQPMAGKVLSFDKTAAHHKKPKEEARHANVEVPKIRARTGLRQKEPKSKVIPYRKNPKSRGVEKKRDVCKPQDMSTDLAGDSVNPTINGVRRAKQEKVKEKMMSVAELREQRRQEREEVAAFNVKAEQTRREVIELRKKLNERFRQSKVEREQRMREQRLARVENEIQFKSQVHVEHKQTLKDQEDMKRRMSVDARAKLRKNHQEGKERMKLLSIQEDQALFEERHESSLAVRNTKLDNAEKRRNSFAFRNGHARKIRQIFADRETEKIQEEHASFELKWAAERDTDAYKRQTAQERRDSLAFRNAEGRRIRDLEGQMKADENYTKHESFELKWDGERDADAYKRQVAKERRDSLAFRNAEGKRIRDLEGQMKADDDHEEHASYELKWEGESDMNNYKKQMAREKRDSFAFRNAEGRRIRDLEGQIRADEHHEEHESYELKWDGERDADNYRKQIDQKRRESLAFRNAESKRIQDLDNQMKSVAHQQEHESYELKWAGERDADCYKKQMEEERRNSFASRNAEGRRIRNLEDQMKSASQQEESKSYELKRAGEQDVDDYKNLVRKEKRDSLAFRNAEGKRIRDLEAQMKADNGYAKHESFELKWAGERDADDYAKQMDRQRRESLEFRNVEGKRIRDLEGQMKYHAQQEEHESFELKWAGERDADDYRKQMDFERRKSLNFRNREAARHDAVMRELQCLAQEKEHESFMLKWSGENDSQQYLADQAELRRKSLAFRNAEGRRHRDIEEENRAKLVGENAQNEELNAACQRDVQQHKKDCAKKDRASLRLKGKENFSIRMRAENDKEVKSQEDHESHLLDTAAWRDVGEYVQECNRRKRLSLAFRAKEKRRHFQIEKEQAESKIHRQHLDTMYRSEDARYIEMAKLKEKARIALEAMNQSPTCTFGANPFATLL